MKLSVSGLTTAVVLAVGLFVSTLPAMPPLDWTGITQEELQRRLNFGVDVVRHPVRDAGRRGVVNGPGEVVPLVSGTKRFPAVMIEFPDQANTWSIDNFDTMLFRTWPSGSARQYYSEVSYGVFNLTGAVYGWYTADTNRAYYGYAMGDVRAAMLAKEAAQKSDAAVDYSAYDNDHDGYVDVFTCIHSGMGREESGNGADIWSHSWSFSDAGLGIYTTNDPDPVNGGYIKIDNYVIDPERTNKSNPGHAGMCCIGVFCHEWGHALGLPDLYDTDGGGQGLGTWCLMAAGSWGGDYNSPAYPVHINAWGKMQLGWLNPTAIRRRNLCSIAQVETLAKAYWLISRQRTFQEYYLVENRRKTRFDVNLYNSGLLMYHIDDSIIEARSSTNRVNADGGSWKYGVALEQADGSDHLFSGGNSGDANDPWPGGLNRTVFDSSTTPNSRTNYPAATPLITSCLAKNIPASSAVVSCTLASGVVGAFTGGPDARGYSWIDSDTTGGPTYVWNDISATGALLGTGDDNLYSLTLPYSFYFYGDMQTAVWVSTNGWLCFGSNPGTSAPANTTVPNAAAPNRAVFAFWDDLNVVAGDSSGIFYRNYGTSPNCSTVVMWKDARRKGANGGGLNPLNQVSFEIVLYEGGRIVVRYRDCSVGDARYNWGRDATAGIENQTGTVGLQYLANGTPLGNLLASERAVQYTCSLNDAEAVSIVAPAGTVDSSGTGITPQAWVRNSGISPVSFPVWLRVAPSYVSNQYNVSNLAPGGSVLVSFSPGWIPALRGPHITKCSTGLAGDNSTGNDTVSGSVTVLVRDVGCSKIEFPYGTVDSGTSITPACSVSNYGTTVEGSYAVRMLVGTGPGYLYNSTATAPSVNPGQRGYVVFSGATANWPRGGPYTVRCSTELTSDLNRGNNSAPQRSVSVQVRDVGCSKIEYPYGSIDSGASITPACSVSNYGTTVEGGYLVRMLVGTGPAYYYNSTATAPSLNPGQRGYVVFSGATANWPRGGPYPVRCSTELTTDLNRGNNSAPQRSVSVQVRDVGCSRIEYPFGTIDTGASITPACSVSNYGTTVEGGYQARMLIGTGPSYAYNSAVPVASLNPGQRTYVTFPTTAVNWTRGPYPVNCSTEFAADATPANNRAPSRSMTVRVRDVGCSKIEFPYGILDSGVSITPACSLRNYGSTTEGGYLVRMLVGTGPGYIYNNTVAAPSLAPAQGTYVTFPVTTANWPRGGPYPVRCSTELTTDLNRGNNQAPQRSVTVQVRDVGCTRIEYPFGGIDSGASITPACSIANYGTTVEGAYTVRMLVGTGPGYLYNGTTSAPSVNPGQLGYVTFPGTTADWPRGGPYAVRCSTELSSDANRSNNSAPQRSLSVQVRDVGCLSILTPSGDVDSAGSLSPQAQVKNFGNQDLSASFNVVFTIGSYSSTKSVPALAQGADTMLVFDSPPWGCPRGPFSGTCATQLSGDMNPANDQQVTSGQVRIVDVGCDAILAPAGNVDSLGPFTPRARVKNYGSEDVTAPFDVVFTIGGYSSTKQVPALAHGATADVDFDGPAWGCPRGAFTAKCSTRYSGDANPDNNAQTQTGTVRVWDVGVAAISAPVGDVVIYSTVSPRAVVQNFGTNDVTCSSRLTIRNASAQVLYDWTESGILVPAGGQVSRTFAASWNPHETGRDSVEVRTSSANDANPTNDICRGLVRAVPLVRSGWAMQTGLPQGMGGKNVKDGGALAYGTTAGNDTGFVYAFKGNNTTEFYRFNVMGNGWIALDTIPLYNRNLKKKGVKKGASLVVGGNGHVYATKGNNTLDWWEYTPGVGHGTWVQKTDVPGGSRNVKEGTGAVAVTEGGVNYVYLLKGSGTFEFYRYNVSANAWETMPSAPLGGGRPFKTGSALAYDGADAIYGLKGNYNEFFGYNVASRFWQPLENLPVGVSKKKVKDGAGLAYDNGIVYGLKGGNTNEFWTFATWMGRWLQGQYIGTSPTGKRVKNGGGLVAATGKSALYAFRGNNTLEFWSYGVPVFDEEPLLAKGPGGVQGADAVRTAEFGLRIAPNPVAQSLNPSISYSLPVAGSVSLRLYDLSGKLVSTLANGYHPAGSYSYSLLSTHYSLASGIYVLRLDSEGRTTTEKLIIE